MKYVLSFLILLLICSCGTGMKIKKENFKEINSPHLGTFELISYQNSSKSNTNRSLLRLFDIEIEDDIKISKITLEFDSNNYLSITYKSILGTETKYFKGELKKKGYFEIFLKKKRILIPLFYTIIDVDRKRIGFTNDGDLIIDNYVNRGGMIFLMAAGGKYRTQYYFKKIKQ
ncbi:hypothetical protein [Aureivirga sp. CE67]|uniref:hypothetical protein n=1 Tax=Aureivirga sp. CE67 TaxID=1788983 RepID=UPI0018CA40AC|nr:hypothetical protein [Aureivirga sp. CE67]